MQGTAILLISCPDQKGIVAAVANFLYQNNANILHADEHIDAENNMFFLRTQWDTKDFRLNHDQVVQLFTPIADKFHMKWQLIFSTNKIRTAIFLSKETHCLTDLLYRYKNNELNSNISLIISNHNTGRQYADFFQIPFYQIHVNDWNKKQAEKNILGLLKDNQIELVILARYMRILSADFINTFKYPIINIHHSFLPAFIGAKPYLQAYKRGVKIIGATAHYVTAMLDQGPIIEQDTLRVSHRDSTEDLIQKGKDIEKIVLSRAVKNHLEHKILTYANKTVVFD